MHIPFRDQTQSIAEHAARLYQLLGYENLQFEISESENMIRTARTDYNEAVQQYNLNVRKFPSNIFAGIFGFDKKSGFAADKGSEKRVNIKDALKD